jgi:hypothetical protein
MDDLESVLDQYVPAEEASDGWVNLNLVGGRKAEESCGGN